MLGSLSVEFAELISEGQKIKFWKLCRKILRTIGIDFNNIQFQNDFAKFLLLMKFFMLSSSVLPENFNVFEIREK